MLASLNFTGSSLWLYVGAATDGLENISGNSNDLIGTPSVPYYLRVKVVGGDIPPTGHSMVCSGIRPRAL